MRRIVLGVGVLLASGCAWGPGMQMDEDRFRAAHAQQAKKSPDEAYKIVLIDATLLGRQLEAQRKLQPPEQRDPLAAMAQGYDYRVSPYDVLSVTVWDHPELTIPAGEFRTPELAGNVVAADGTMFFPHAGVLKVGGKTLREVRELLTQRLANVIERPQLDVRVVGFRGQRVQVTGEVTAPGTYPVTDVPMYVQDAIAQARGMGPEADLRNVTLSRGGKTFTLDLQALYEKGDTSQNWLLQGGDIVNVPDRSRNKVFVLGEVRKPQSRVMVKGRMTLAEAIGDTEGFNEETSDPSRVYVIRGGLERPTIYKLDASSPDALLLATQFQLQPSDVVYVSAHNLTRWNRIISQIEPTVRLLWEASTLTYQSINWNYRQ